MFCLFFVLLPLLLRAQRLRRAVRSSVLSSAAVCKTRQISDAGGFAQLLHIKKDVLPASERTSSAFLLFSAPTASHPPDYARKRKVDREVNQKRKPKQHEHIRHMNRPPIESVNPCSVIGVCLTDDELRTRHQLHRNQTRHVAAVLDGRNHL